MRLAARILVALAIVTAGAPTVRAQQITDTKRESNRLQLAQLLESYGSTIDMPFRQSTKQKYNYVGTLTKGLTFADSFEIVFGVTDVDTYSVRVFPHYKGGYINVDKARDRLSLMRQLLRLSDTTFLFWAADDAGDVFTGFTFTLESGFPEEAIKIVLRSIVNHDKYVGELRAAID